MERQKIEQQKKWNNRMGERNTLPLPHNSLVRLDLQLVRRRVEL
jgi:hypothetical protein